MLCFIAHRQRRQREGGEVRYSERHWSSWKPPPAETHATASRARARPISAWSRGTVQIEYFAAVNGLNYAVNDDANIRLTPAAKYSR